MPVLTGLATACPEHLCRQEDVRSFAAGLFGGRAGNRIDRLAQLFDNAGIHTRHFASPLEWYGLEHDFTQKNARYVDAATELAERVVRRCLDNAATAARDIDHIVFATSTGVSTPSLEARIAGRLGFSQRIRRTPIWGLGCAGGAGGLARAADFARAEPESRVLFVSLELCSLTFQKNDLSKSNLVAAALFGDGAAAILVLGDAVAARSAAPGGASLAQPPLGQHAVARIARCHGLGTQPGGAQGDVLARHPEDCQGLAQTATRRVSRSPRPDTVDHRASRISPGRPARSRRLSARPRSLRGLAAAGA